MMPSWIAAKVALKTGWLLFIGAVVVGALGLAAVQTVRLEGLQVWPIAIDGWIEVAADRQQQIDSFLQAQASAEDAAQEQKRNDEARYRAIAQRIDDNAQDETESALRLADEFIAAGGLQREGAGSAPCPAPACAGDHRADDPAAASRAAQLDDAGDRPGAGLADRTGEGLVTVTAEDIRICTRNTIKAEAGRDFALQLQQASAGADQTETPRVSGGGNGAE